MATTQPLKQTWARNLLVLLVMFANQPWGIPHRPRSQIVWGIRDLQWHQVLDRTVLLWITKRLDPRGHWAKSLKKSMFWGGPTNSRSSGPAVPSPSEDKGSVGLQDGGVPGSKAQSPLEDEAVPNIWEVVIRDKGGSTTGYSLIVPLKVKGKDLDGVVDTGADGTVINSKFIDITQFEAEPVALKGLEPNRLITGHCIKDVPINLGGGCIARIYMLHLLPMTCWVWTS